MKRAAAVGVVLLLAGACSEQSNVAPEANVTVRGTVTDVDGTPLSARPVELGSGVSDLEGGAGFLTAGLFCLGGACSGDRFDTTTADDGSYAFELSGSDTQSTFGEAVSFLLSASAEPRGEHPTGPAVAARFRIQATELVLPDLGLIDPELRLTPEDAAVVSGWDGSAAPGPYVVAFAASDGEPVWEASTAEATARIDARVLEDATGVAIVSGSRRDTIEGSDLSITWRSSGVAFQGGFGAPPSRGVPCELRGAGGAVQVLDGCSLTDGSFRSAGMPSTVCPEGPSTTTCTPVTSVRLQLPEPVPADLLVVRGCEDPCRAAVVAGDAATATDVGPISGTFTATALRGTPITGVELTAADLTTVAEVSVWAPITATDRPALLPVEDPIVLDETGGGDDGDRRRVAAVAAAVLLVGAAFLLGRSRRTLPPS